MRYLIFCCCCISIFTLYSQDFRSLEAPAKLHPADETVLVDTLTRKWVFEQWRRADTLCYIDSAESTWLAVGKFKFNQDHEAYLVHMKESWFWTDILFLKNLQTGNWDYTERVGQFYGGDGGQECVFTWLEDVNEDQVPDLVLRSQEHAMINKGRNRIESKYRDDVEIKVWTKEGFVPWTKKFQKSYYIKKYPIEFL